MNTSQRAGSHRHYIETKGPNAGGSCWVERFEGGGHKTHHVGDDDTLVRTHGPDESVESRVEPGNTMETFEENVASQVPDDPAPSPEPEPEQSSSDSGSENDS